ncbi:hypothetical protein J4210_01525 [Candidatus Woesearchaeota archaeon]|nr:hypothetical protein [Candidatus Woesearchaeota archaeon]
MKHSFKVTWVLLLLFLLIQFIGIAVLQQYVDVSQSTAEEIVFAELPIGERPPLEENNSYITIIFAVLLGTGLAFLLMHYHLVWLWKAWFFIAVFTTLLISFGAFLPVWLAFILSFVLTTWRLIKPNFFIQTGTELFVYPGLAAIFVPLFSLTSISILLVLISFYDAYAVWKSKHMITLAKSQAKAKIFAGLLVPYAVRKQELVSPRQQKLGKEEKKRKNGKYLIRTAILGGGDVAFPLLFAGVVFKELGLWQSLIIPLFAALGLGLLFWKAKEKKFYPAMPFISIGCFVGLLVVWLIGLL